MPDRGPISSADIEEGDRCAVFDCGGVLRLAPPIDGDAMAEPYLKCSNCGQEYKNVENQG